MSAVALLEAAAILAANHPGTAESPLARPAYGELAVLGRRPLARWARSITQCADTEIASNHAQWCRRPLSCPLNRAAEFMLAVVMSPSASGRGSYPATAIRSLDRPSCRSRQSHQRTSSDSIVVAADDRPFARRFRAASLHCVCHSRAHPVQHIDTADSIPTAHTKQPSCHQAGGVRSSPARRARS